MKPEEIWERKKDTLPGGPAYESPELAEDMTYWDKMVESINQQTKEIRKWRKS